MPRHSRQPVIVEPSLSALRAAAAAVDLSRHIITYDSDDPSTYSAFSLPRATVTKTGTLAPIPWPAGDAPAPQPLAKTPAPASPLPQADYVVVTWTVEEAKALADTLTPGHPSATAWYHYTHNFETEFVPIIKKGAPSLESKRLGSYFLTSIAGKRVLCMKSELHLSQDGPKIPVAKLWAQIIAEAKPRLIITTGTAGGIGAAVELGDVLCGQFVRFDCLKAFKAEPFHASIYPCSALVHASITVAEKLVQTNAAQLPAATRPPQIFAAAATEMPVPDIVTTDFFAFDDSANTYGLQGLGGTVEMGDAVLGMVISEMATGAPLWISVRNASDPQIASAGLTVAQQAEKAAQIYEKFGYWTTIPSAIACWSVILDN